MPRDFLQATLIDVRDRGSACVEKRKLLWMLGRKNDAASAWGMLLDEWEEIGQARPTLHGVEEGPFVTLTVRKPQSVAEDWAAEE